MPYIGELIIDTVSAKVDHAMIQNQPAFATVEQLVAMNGAKVQGGAMDSAKGNLSSKTSSVDILREVSQALDDLKIPTKRIETSRDAGFTGDIRHDSEHLYVCVGTNNWKRVKLESF